MSLPVRTFAALTSVLCMLCFTTAAVAQTHDELVKLNISAGSLTQAIERLVDESGVQIMYEPAVTQGLTVGALNDTLTVNEALSRLLLRTGLRADRVNEKTVVLKRAAAAKTPSAQDASDSAPSRASEEAASTPQEIVVSAQKRGDERLQDTPVPIAVLNADSLTSNNQVLLRDYYSSVPGLSVSPDIENQQELSIRGISQSGGNPTVAVVVDDIPYGSSTNIGGNTIPDIDPGDLARIEVLRGPQGTLYGANSMGGLVRYVTKDPSLESFSGRIEAGTSDVHNGSEPGFNLRASGNMPLSDTLAVRVSGFARQDPGYIDNVFRNIKGINEAQSYGSRLSGLWQPSSAFSLKLSALYQNTRGNGVSEIEKAVNGYVGPPLADLQQSYVAGVDRYKITTQAYSAAVKAEFGSLHFSSDTGYSINHATSPFDFSFAFGGAFGALGYGVTGAPLITDVHVHKISEELRLAGDIGPSFDWLVGGFYTHENESPAYHQTIYEADVTTGKSVGVFYDADTLDTFDEYAVFGNLTYHFTERLDIQVGARESHNHQDFRSVTSGPFVPLINHFTSPETLTGSAAGNAFTYLVTPQFKLSSDLMLYARLASGYRPGGPNPAPIPGIPPTFSPDKTYNYEVGLKGDFLDHTLSVDASLYYVDWKDLQLQLQTLYGYEANGSEAKSEGLELSVSSRPLTGLSISGWIDYDNAVLTDDFPASSTAVGTSGEKLPNTPKFSANLSFEQNFPLGDRLNGFVGAAASYVGSRQGFFNKTAAREVYPSYTKTDIRVGLRFDSWMTSIYANNVADTRGITSGGIGYYVPWAYTVIQPRTIGLSVSRTF